jgi:hypothetical protein
MSDLQRALDAERDLQFMKDHVLELELQHAKSKDDLDSIARAVYPHKEPGFTYAVTFMVEEIEKMQQYRWALDVARAALGLNHLANREDA